MHTVAIIRETSFVIEKKTYCEKTSCERWTVAWKLNLYVFFVADVLDLDQVISPCYIRNINYRNIIRSLVLLHSSLFKNVLKQLFHFFLSWIHFFKHTCIEVVLSKYENFLCVEKLVKCVEVICRLYVSVTDIWPFISVQICKETFTYHWSTAM